MCEELLLYSSTVLRVSTVNSVLLVFQAPLLSHRKRVCGNDVCVDVTDTFSSVQQHVNLTLSPNKSQFT